MGRHLSVIKMLSVLLVTGLNN